MPRDDGGGKYVRPPRRQDSFSDYSEPPRLDRSASSMRRPSARELALDLSFLGGRERTVAGRSSAPEPLRSRPSAKGPARAGLGEGPNGKNQSAGGKSKRDGPPPVRTLVRVRKGAGASASSGKNGDGRDASGGRNGAMGSTAKGSSSRSRDAWRDQRRGGGGGVPPSYSSGARRGRDEDDDNGRLSFEDDREDLFMGANRRGSDAAVSRPRSGSIAEENEADKKTRAEYREMGRDFAEFNAEQLESFITRFMSVDTERLGYLRPETLVELLSSVGENVEKGELDALVHSIDVDNSGTIEFDEFLLLLRKMRATQAGKAQGFGALYKKLIMGQKSWMHLFRNVNARRNVDLLMRTKSQMLVQHYAMADNKANILITVCSIVLSFSIQQISSNQASFSLLTFTAFTIVALFFAVGSVLPRYQSKAQVSSSNSKVDNFNLLFFEDFAKIPLDTFMEAMSETLKHDDKLYAELCRDLYLTGVNLSVNKYKWLRRSYLTFGYGTICTVLVFFVTALADLDAQEMVFGE